MLPVESGGKGSHFQGGTGASVRVHLEWSGYRDAGLRETCPCHGEEGRGGMAHKGW